MKKICMWSGPRNVSTAMMYSFAQRKDTVVIDEPLYGHYLKVTGAQHPGREEILKEISSDGYEIMKSIMNRDYEKYEIVFMKQMSHHLIEINKDFVFETENIFLIRNPKDVISSLVNQIPNARLRDTGLDLQWDLFEEIRSKSKRPIVIDSKRLLLNPRKVLSQLCERLEIPFLKNMLSWDQGPINEDGIWAKYWYQRVHQSNGFIPYKEKPDLSHKLLGLLEECQPYYDSLLRYELNSK